MTLRPALRILGRRLAAGLAYAAGAAALTTFAAWAALAPKACAAPGARPAVAAVLFGAGRPADAHCRPQATRPPDGPVKS